MDKIIKVSQSFLKDSIWMACRYCIGRHTITASTFPDDVIKYVKYLSDSEKDFLAKDINREITNCYNFNDNIDIIGFSHNYDAFSLIVKYLSQNDVDFKNNRFVININTGEINHESFEPTKNYNRSPEDDFIDMIGWARLSQYLRGDFKTVVTEYNGEAKEMKCIETYTYNYNTKKLEKVYMSINYCESSLTRGIYINEQYIKEIK